MLPKPAIRKLISNIVLSTHLLTPLREGSAEPSPSERAGWGLYFLSLALSLSAAAGAAAAGVAPAAVQQQRRLHRCNFFFNYAPVPELLANGLDGECRIVTPGSSMSFILLISPVHTGNINFNNTWNIFRQARIFSFLKTVSRTPPSVIPLGSFKF